MDTTTIIILFLSIFYVKSQVISGKCLTPDNLMGECRELNSCDFVLNMLMKRLNSETINSIRKYHCGFKGSQPFVCCPNNATMSEHPNLRLLPKDCGLWSVNHVHLIGPSKPDFPSNALLSYKDGKFRCGGVLINERYVLTAAHCITQLPKGLELKSVRLNEYDIDTDPDCLDYLPDLCAPPVEDYDIEEIIPHPEFDHENMQNDIGIIRLDRNVNFTDGGPLPICMPIKPIKEFERFMLTGWGITKEDISSETVAWAKAERVDTTTCADLYKNVISIDKGTHTCIEDEYSRNGTCVGDSGGPLIGETGLLTVRGIMSFSSGECKNESMPRVYTLVEPYLDWILSSMKD